MKMKNSVLLTCFFKFLVMIATIHTAEDKNFYSFSMKDIAGKDVSFERFKGKVVLMTNVASECMYTDEHYKGYNKMFDSLSKTGRFTILAFPCNQFNSREPGTPKDIEKFVRDKYHGNFELFQKVNVIDENVPGVWRYVTAKCGEAPPWNFSKYLLDHKGELLAWWGPETPVEAIAREIENAVQLAEKELGVLQTKSDIEPTAGHGGKTQEEADAPEKLEL